MMEGMNKNRRLMNTTLFISDVHLSEFYPHITSTFLYFLEHTAAQADVLYILGDFFDAYLGDDDNSDLIQTIVSAFVTLTDKGVPVFLMPGNHDFLISKKFAARSHITLLKDPCVVRIYDQPILLMHGDSLCLKDHWHQRFRKLIHNRFLQKLFLFLPLFFRKKISLSFHRDNEQRYQRATSNLMEITEETATTLMKKYNVNRMIHGHTHQPAIHVLSNGERMVMDSWHSHGNYLEIDQTGAAKLVDLPHSSKITR